MCWRAGLSTHNVRKELLTVGVARALALFHYCVPIHNFCQQPFPPFGCVDCLSKFVVIPTGEEMAMQPAVANWMPKSKYRSHTSATKRWLWFVRDKTTISISRGCQPWLAFENVTHIMQSFQNKWSL